MKIRHSLLNGSVLVLGGVFLGLALLLTYTYYFLPSAFVDGISFQRYNDVVAGGTAGVFPKEYELHLYSVSLVILFVSILAVLAIWRVLRTRFDASISAICLGGSLSFFGILYAAYFLHQYDTYKPGKWQKFEGTKTPEFRNGKLKAQIRFLSEKGYLKLAIRHRPSRFQRNYMLEVTPTEVSFHIEENGVPFKALKQSPGWNPNLYESHPQLIGPFVQWPIEIFTFERKIQIKVGERTLNQRDFDAHFLGSISLIEQSDVEWLDSQFSLSPQQELVLFPYLIAYVLISILLPFGWLAIKSHSAKTERNFVERKLFSNWLKRLALSNWLSYVSYLILLVLVWGIYFPAIVKGESTTAFQKIAFLLFPFVSLYGLIRFGKTLSDRRVAPLVMSLPLLVCLPIQLYCSHHPILLGWSVVGLFGCTFLAIVFCHKWAPHVEVNWNLSRFHRIWLVVCLGVVPLLLAMRLHHPIYHYPYDIHEENIVAPLNDLQHGKILGAESRVLYCIGLITFIKSISENFLGGVSLYNYRLILVGINVMGVLLMLALLWKLTRSPWAGPLLMFPLFGLWRIGNNAQSDFIGHATPISYLFDTAPNSAHFFFPYSLLRFEWLGILMGLLLFYYLKRRRLMALWPLALLAAFGPLISTEGGVAALLAFQIILISIHLYDGYRGKRFLRALLKSEAVFVSALALAGGILLYPAWAADRLSGFGDYITWDFRNLGLGNLAFPFSLDEMAFWGQFFKTGTLRDLLLTMLILGYTLYRLVTYSATRTVFVLQFLCFYNFVIYAYVFDRHWFGTLNNGISCLLVSYLIWKSLRLYSIHLRFNGWAWGRLATASICLVVLLNPHAYYRIAKGLVVKAKKVAYDVAVADPAPPVRERDYRIIGEESTQVVEYLEQVYRTDPGSAIVFSTGHGGSAIHLLLSGVPSATGYGFPQGIMEEKTVAFVLNEIRVQKPKLILISEKDNPNFPTDFADFARLNYKEAGKIGRFTIFKW